MNKKHYLYIITIFISFCISLSYAQDSSSSSEESGYLGSLCKIPNNLYAPVSSLKGIHQNLYSLMPYISNSDDIYVSDCSCKEDGSFVCTYKNLGLGQGYTPSYVPLCDLREAYWCPQIEKGECNFTGSSVAIHYSDRYVSTGYKWGAMNFSGTEIMDIENSSQPVYVESSIGTLLFFYMRHVLPQGVTTYELRNAFFKAYPRFPSMDRMNDYCRGEWVPHDENCFGTEQEAILAAEDSTDNCTLGAGIGYYSPKFTEKNGWCAVGNCEGGEFYSSAAESSNSTQLLSSSSYEESSSSSSEGSSSSSTLCEKHPLISVPQNTQSTCFNVNGTCYKCKSERGSACGEEWLWKGNFNPSNVGWWYTEVDCATGIEKTKDEGIGLCPSHPLTKVPSDPQNACFALGGKCYKCKSERSSACGEEWLWKGNFNPSNVGYWYTEVDCETGSEKTTEEETIGLCPSHPLTKVPSDPQNACFALGGKCYKCKNERGSACGEEWLWKGNFNSSNVGYWYTEVDCYNPFEDNHDGQCPDGSILQKRVANSDNGSKEGYVDYTMELLNTQKYYDVLGRNVNRHSKQKRALYRLDRMSSIEKDITMEGYIGSFTGKGCYKNSSGEWVCSFNENYSPLKKQNTEPCGILGVDYGIISEKGALIGGINCPSVNVPNTVISQKSDKIGVCKDGSDLLEGTITVTGSAVLERNEIFYITEGYLFPNGYYATKEDEKAMYYHELGHQKYNKCIHFPDMLETTPFCICESEFKEKAGILGEDLRQKAIDKLKKMIDEQSDLFHSNYGEDGYATSYNCPN